MKSSEYHPAGCSKPDPGLEIPTARHYDTGDSDKGFTLVELIVVVAILAVLALLAIPSYNNYVLLAKNSRTMSDIRLLEKEIDAYILDKNTLPASLADIRRDTFPDAWNHPYVFYPIDTTVVPPALDPLQRIDRFMNPLNTDFDLYSLGPDGLTNLDISQLDGQNDIIRASGGGYVGTGKAF